jgi:hypothetical protein
MSRRIGACGDSCARAAGGRLLLGLLLLGLAPRPAAAKIVYTTCQDICSTYTSTLSIVTAAKDITPGSDVDCTDARDIQVNGGELRVHDGRFTLRGKSLSLQNGGRLVADCPQAFDAIGYRVEVLDAISIAANSAGKMTARGGVQGGAIGLLAGTSVTIDGLGIDANGSATDAPGGSVAIEAGTTASILASVSADGFGGVAEGGRISVDAADIAVQAEVRAKGYGANGVDAPGGDITLSATGNVTVSGGYGLNAESGLGSGGAVAVEAGNTVTVGKPIRAGGTGSAIGTGGGIELTGNRIVVDDACSHQGEKPAEPSGSRRRATPSRSERGLTRQFWMPRGAMAAPAGRLPWWRRGAPSRWGPTQPSRPTSPQDRAGSFMWKGRM